MIVKSSEQQSNGKTKDREWHLYTEKRDAAVSMESNVIKDNLFDSIAISLKLIHHSDCFNNLISIILLLKQEDCLQLPRCWQILSMQQHFFSRV